MVSVFLREQKRYTQSDLTTLFCCGEGEAVRIIKRLKAYGVLKAVKLNDDQRNLSDLMDEDIEIADVEVGENEYLYVFTFVGVITMEGRVLKCYPKYIAHADMLKEELKLVVRVLEKYDATEQIIHMYNETSDGSTFNMLAIMLFLLRDYHEYGVYSNTQDIIEPNGDGEILWDKTINETFTLISQNKPYYPELWTRRRVGDDFDYFKRLHACILTICTKELCDADLLDLFDIAGAEISDETLSDFGETDYILNRIQKEIDIQFHTRKQRLLKAIYTYIDHSGSLNDLDCFSMFGTNRFHHVWETVCAEIMDNQLTKPIGALPLPKPLAPRYDKRSRLIDLIERPVWTALDSNTPYSVTAGATLTPDLVSIHRKGNEWQFIIFDAKYYFMQLEPGKPLCGQPGIESVTKQYLYQLAFCDFVAEHGFSSVKNCFLLPTEQNEIVCKGTVALNMLTKLGLQEIQLCFLPAKTAFEHYVAGIKFDIGRLKL